MTKKVVKNRESYLKNWTAVITGSVLFVSAQAAQAANEGRQSFRSFRDNNPGFDRHTARQMFRQEFRGDRGGNGVVGVCPVPNVPQVNNVPPVMQVPTSRDESRGRWQNRLERNDGVIKQSLQVNDNGRLVNMNGGVNLDLTSQARNITLGTKLFGGVSSIEINVGGETKTLSAGSQVTAAEYIAAKQVLAGAGQKVTIGGGGAATGGEVDLSAITSQGDVMRARDLTVPVNVTTLGDFSKGSEFKLQGDLHNYGTVHAMDGGGNGRGGTIHADDINNNAGALISSEVDLTLRADGALTNLGSITSDGNLTLSASNIRNSGSVSSAKNVNLDAAGDLSVNNAGGTISADQAINVRSADYAGSADTTLQGGDWLSNDLNLNAGAGTVKAAVGNVSGDVNSTGYAVHFQSASETLNIGDTDLIDPTFFNFGNINFTGNLSVADNLTIIATGNITESVVGAFTIDTNGGGTAADGGFLTMIAGANITSASPNTPDPSLPGANPGSAVTINQGSISGGSILLGNVNLNTFGTTGNGGGVLLAAYQGTAAGSGQVNLASGGTTTGSSINTGGAGFGSNGSVTILGAGGVDINAGGLGAINATGGSGGGGIVQIQTGQPFSFGPVSWNANGSLASGQIIPGSVISNGVVDVNNINANVLSMQSGGNMSVGNLNIINSIQMQAGIDQGGNIINPAGSMTIAGDVTAGSALLIRTADNLTQNNNADISASNVQIFVGTTNAAAPGGADYTQNGSIASTSGAITVQVGDDYTIGNGAADTINAATNVNLTTGVISGAGDLTVNAAITAGGGASDGSVNITANGDFDAANANADITAGQGGAGFTGGVTIVADDFQTSTGANILGRTVNLTASTDNGGTFDLDGNVTANGAGSNLTLLLQGANDATIADANVSGGLSADRIILQNTTANGGIQILNTGATPIDFIDVTAQANGDITLVEPDLATTDGNINFRGASSTFGTFTVLADHDITGTAGLHLIQAETLNLTSNGSAGFGNIGTDASNRLEILADNLRVQALGTPSAVSGNAYLVSVGAGSTTFVGGISQVTGTLDMTAFSDLLTAPGSQITATRVVLDTDGNIGGDLFNPFRVDASTAVGGGITANGANVYLLEANDGALIGGASGATGDFFAVATGNLTVGSNVSADNVILDAGNDLTLNAGTTVNGTTDIVLAADDDIFADATSKVTGGELTVAFADTLGDSPVTLNTAVTALETTAGALRTLTINEDDGITLGAQVNLASLTLNAGLAGAGTVDTSSDFSLVSLDVSNDNGDIVISNDVTATAVASLSTTLGTGNILAGNAGASLSSAIINLNTDAGSIGSASQAFNVNGVSNASTTINAQSLSQGDVNLAYLGTGVATLGASSGNDDFKIAATNGGDITFGGNIAGAGDLDVTTDTLNFGGAFTVDFNEINIRSQAGSGFTLNGAGGTFMSDTTGNGVNFVATDGNFVNNGTTNFNGGDVSVLLGNNNGTNAFTNNGTLNGDNNTNSLTIEARVVTLGTITNFAPVTIVNGNTIINSNGDVTLPDNLIFQGENLAIIASGNITATGAVLIDLSSNTGDGGTLTVLAGFAVTPSTTGQEQTDEAFTITGFSTSGGNVNLTGVNIITSSTTGSAGDVQIYANGGNTNAGTVVVGDVTANGAIDGGLVLIGGESNVTVGNVSTLGTAGSDNDILLGVGTVIISGTLTVTDGTLSGGAVTPAMITAGDLTFGTLNAGTDGDVTLLGGFGVGDTISSTGTITADELEILIAGGSATLNNTAVNSLAATGLGTDGSITLANEAGAIEINEVTGDLDLNVTATGAITVSEAVDVGGSVDLESTQVGGDGIIVNAAIDADNNLTLTASNSDIVLNEDVSSLGTTTIDGLNVEQTVGFVSGDDLVLNSTSAVTLSAVASTLTANVAALTLSNNSTSLTINHLTASGAVSVINTGDIFVEGVLDSDASISLDAGDVLTVNETITADMGVALNATNDVTINANVTAVDGAMTIISETGNIAVATNVDILGDDSILIQSVGNGTINIGAGASIVTDAKTLGEGNVSIVQGALPTKTKNLKGKNLEIVLQDGEVLTGRGKGTKKVVANAPDNVITAQGADVLIKASAKNGVILGGGVTITADPPVAAGTPITIVQWGNDSTSQGGNVSGVSNELPVSLASLNAPSAMAPINTMTTANAAVLNTGSLANSLSNLVTANQQNASFAGQEDDSYMVSYAPMGMAVDGKVCSDIEFAFASSTSGNKFATIKHSDCVTLDKGSALFVPSKNMTVVTPKGQVKLGANSVAFITVDADQLSVYDINDHQKGSVVVSAGGRDMALTPGRHMIVTHDRAASFADANPIESIMHRAVNRHELGAGKRAFTTEFSIPSAVQVVNPLRALMQSNDAAAKKVSERVIKTSAVMMYMGQATPFEFHAKPKTVALSAHR